MSRVLSHPLATRRTVVLLVAIAAAVLVALGLLLDPAASDRTSSEDAAPMTDATTVAEPNAIAGTADPAAVGATGPGAEVDPAAPVDGDARAIEKAAGGAADEVASSSYVATGALEAPSVDAKIIRSATIELDVRRGSFEDAWGDAQAIAAAHGGYIVSASRSGAGDSSRLGTITMRVPTGKFDTAVDRVREIDRTKVERLDVASQDVTQEYVDTKSRLRHDRAVETRLLALLAQTDGVSEVLAVQSRLDQVQEQIEVSKGRIDYLDKLTAMSTITVSLHGPGTRADARDDDSVLGEALVDARERFAENVANAIVWVGGALPALLLLAALALLGRTAWRRRTARSTPDRGSDTLA